MSSRAQHYREAERLLEALPPDKRGRHAGDEGSGADAGGITRPCKGIDECRRCALFRDGIQFCSGLVGLVVCVGGHGGGANRLALAGERFVGLVAEDLAEVGDGFARLWTAPDRHAEYQRSALT